MCSGPAAAEVFWSSPLKAIPREESGKITDGVKGGGDKRVGGVRLQPAKGGVRELRKEAEEEEDIRRRGCDPISLLIPDLIQILKRTGPSPEKRRVHFTGAAHMK